MLAPVPPLGLASLAAVLERSGCEVRVEDQFATQATNGDLARRILGVAPDLVGIGSLTPSIHHATALTGLLRAHGFSGTVVLGGVHPTLFADTLLGDGACDVVIRGEGEVTLAALADALQGGRPLRGLEGLSYRDGEGATVHEAARDQIDDLDSLPFPAWHLFDLERYRSAPMLMISGLALPILASRGCPERCTFCGQEIFAPRLRVRSVDSVMAEIDELVDRHHIEYFVFADANFPVSKRYGLAFCERFRRSRHWGKVRWSCEVKADLVDRELLRAFADAGCYLIEFGLEVGDPRILESIGKRTTLDQGERAVRMCKEVGIRTLGLFMIGLPGEGRREIARTFRFARRVACDMSKFNICIPLPGSPLFRQVEHLLPQPLEPETFSSWYRPHRGERPMTVVPGGLTAPQLIRLQAMGMATFYLRPGFVWQQLRGHSLPWSDVLDGGRFLVEEMMQSFRAQRTS